MIFSMQCFRDASNYWIHVSSFENVCKQLKKTVLVELVELVISNQIKSLLLSHHHSTSALVSEILMSVLQTVQKNNRQFIYGQTVQKNNNKQFTYGQTVQKKKKQQQQFTYGQTVQKKKTTTAIYIWTDSAKKNNNSNLHMDRQCKKNNSNLHMDRQCKKNNSNLHMDRQCKKNNSNLHMDSTYLQTVQKTMCKIHIHALSTLSVL